jgi:hypothetical protein
MPSFLRDVLVHNIVINDEAIKELNRVFLERVNIHNGSVKEDNRQLTHWYVVRFDDRGYRTLSADEAWAFYMGANHVERIILQAECPVGLQSNRLIGEQIEIRLDSDPKGASHIIVGGESRDWVEATFIQLETVLRRRKDLATTLIRTPWTGLLLQIAGVLVGVLLALWLATLSAPLLKGVEYPRAVSFAFWLLIYSNLWSYVQQRAIAGIEALFPNVRITRTDEHWTKRLLRDGTKTVAVAAWLWIFGWLMKWVTSVLAPLLAGSP